MNLENLITDIQRTLGVAADGKAGVQTWTALHARICGHSSAPTLQAGQVDERSERHIGTLHPRVRDYARALVHSAAGQGITIKVISATRTYEEQAALYAKGRTAPGTRVTNAPPGYSNHNFGLAFDIGIFKGTAYQPESPIYKAVGALGRSLGLEWGGDWKSLMDEPHFQLRPAWAAGMPERQMLAELRRRKQTGQDLFAA